MIAIFGPTGVGKTEIAVELADLLRARGEDPVAVSADAIAVYEGLDVLAAKPATDRLEHRLVSCVPIEEEFSAGRFAELAHAEIDGLLAEGRTPIVVGGTGLYLRAALTELDLRPPVEPDLRAGLERELAEVGPATLHGRLSPQTAASVHPNDRKRIVRALELEQSRHGPAPRLRSAVVRGAAAPHGAVRDRHGSRRARGPDRGPGRRDARRRRGRGGRARPRAGCLAHGAQGARVQGDRRPPRRRGEPG